MLHRVAVAIHAERPRLTFYARAVIEAILLSKGSIGTAREVAEVFGVSRFKLARLLKDEGLPSLHRLSEWITVLSWVDAAEREGLSLCAMAFRSHRDPSACYRLVKKLTGRRWEVVQTKGGAWVMKQFLDELETLKKS